MGVTDLSYVTTMMRGASYCRIGFNLSGTARARVRSDKGQVP
jgi:hypothetical protein